MQQALNSASLRLSETLVRLSEKLPPFDTILKAPRVGKAKLWLYRRALLKITQGDNFLYRSQDKCF
jgi:hypothetical protein